MKASLKSARSYIAIFMAVFIWSSAFIAAKTALSGMGPVTLALVRTSIAFVVLLPFALKRGFKFKSLFTKTALICGLTGYGGNLFFLNIGLQTCSTNISAIIHGLFPVFMVFFGRLMLEEKVTPGKVLGIVFSVIGVIIASIGDFRGNSGTTLWGIFCIVICVLLWAFYSVYVKKTISHLDSFAITQINFGGSILVLIPVTAIEIYVGGIGMPNTAAWLSMLYLGVFSGAFGILLWNYGLKKVSSATAGIYFNLMPVIGVGFALAVGETITILQVVGCALVLAGVIVSSKSL